MESKKFALLTGVTVSVLIIVIIVTLTLGKSGQAPTTMQQTISTTTAENTNSNSGAGGTAQNYSYAGTNGRHSFNMTYPSNWTLQDLSAKHRGLWLQLTSGKAVIIINQEINSGETCAYPHDNIPDAESFGPFTAVKTKSGQNFRAASPIDYPTAMYACEENTAVDGVHYGKLTSIGQIFVANPANSAAVNKDFVSIVQSLDISPR